MYSGARSNISKNIGAQVNLKYSCKKNVWGMKLNEEETDFSHEVSTQT